MTTFASLLHAPGEAVDATVHGRVSRHGSQKEREICATRMNSFGGVVMQEQSTDRRKHAYGSNYL